MGWGDAEGTGWKGKARGSDKFHKQLQIETTMDSMRIEFFSRSRATISLSTLCGLWI